MKNIIAKLESNAINYTMENYGGNYFGPQFTVKGIVIMVRNYGVIENCEENVQRVLKSISRSGKYTVVNNSSYGKESYIIYLSSDYKALCDYRMDVHETSERFWQIWKVSGKAAADVYFRNVCRLKNFKLVV